MIRRCPRAIAQNLCTALVLFAAGPASALSCIFPTVEQVYGSAAGSLDSYVIAAGSLDVTGQSRPPEGAVALNGDTNNMQGYTQPARFDGMRFTSSGFNEPWSQDLLVEVSCVAAWCGQAERVEDGLFFIRQNADGTYALEVGACPANVFANPTQADLRQVQVCHSVGNC